MRNPLPVKSLLLLVVGCVQMNRRASLCTCRKGRGGGRIDRADSALVSLYSTSIDDGDTPNEHLEHVRLAPSAPFTVDPNQRRLELAVSVDEQRRERFGLDGRRKVEVGREGPEELGVRIRAGER